jgi:hypothetical protein
MSGLTYHVALVSESASVTFADLSSASAALQKQVTRDFGPIWSVDATVDCFDTLESVPIDYWPVILLDQIDNPAVAGYHQLEDGQPLARVQVDSKWIITASHEALEMLADPFGNTVRAGAPPPQAPAPISSLPRVNYLVEVCDPCEGATYPVNGVIVSDFITPQYYDPVAVTGVRYSFMGNITAPHQVLEGGYVSFNNPSDNQWYQVQVTNGAVQLSNLGSLPPTGMRGIREVIDGRVREARREERYRLRPADIGTITAVSEPGVTEASRARAELIRRSMGGENGKAADGDS